MGTRIARRGSLAIGLCLALSTVGAAAQPTMGLAVVDGHSGNGPVTVFYPSDAPGSPVTRGPFTVDVAWQGAPRVGNRRLVVISHGSGGAPWPFADLARMLVNTGFGVAVPEHEGDNYHDQRLVGPESWKRRPGEVIAAIDALKTDVRLGLEAPVAERGDDEAATRVVVRARPAGRDRRNLSPPVTLPRLDSAPC